jgi:sorbitol-specific phosphotransferase system component IIA
MMTWWMAGAQLPQETFEKIDQAGFGPWVPLHLTLAHKFAQALRRSGIDAPWINASYPDVVNCVLGKVGMAPLVGLGNMDLMIPGIQHAAAQKLGLPMRSIQVFLVADHFIVHHLNAYASTGGAPYFLKIHANGRDVTERLDLERVLIEANRYMPKGRDDHFIVAASAVKNALAALNDSHILTHSPGPGGLPGGYPITIGKKSAEIVLPGGIEKEEAIEMNHRAQKFDGIDEIKEDGTIVFTQKSVDIMKKMLNYECKTLSLNECESRANELLRLYRDFLISETKP